MAQNISVPDIGDFKDVEVIEVLVKPGDQINKNDPIVTIDRIEPWMIKEWLKRQIFLDLQFWQPITLQTIDQQGPIIPLYGNL